VPSLLRLKPRCARSRGARCRAAPWHRPRNGRACFVQRLRRRRQGAAEALRLLQKLHADRQETEVQLRKDSDQATINPNMEEMLEDVKHPRALQKEGMNKQTGAEPPRTAGVPNTRGYQEDQPLDAASATCCALLRPLPQERPLGSRPRRRTRHATNSRHSKR